MRMIRRQQLAVRPNQGVGADGDATVVQKHAIEIDKRTFAYADSSAVVTMEWRADDYRRMRIGNQSPDASMQFLHVPCPATVEVPHRVISAQDTCLNLFVRVVVRQVVEHFSYSVMIYPFAVFCAAKVTLFSDMTKQKTFFFALKKAFLTFFLILRHFFKKSGSFSNDLETLLHTA